MTLLEKIDAIRQQPEPVRLRYVWLCVSVSMFFVFTLWILSLQAHFPKIAPLAADSQLPSLTDAAKTPATEPSLQEMLQKSDR